VTNVGVDSQNEGFGQVALDAPGRDSVAATTAEGLEPMRAVDDRVARAVDQNRRELIKDLDEGAYVTVVELGMPWR
jgi:hypothetical protein